ncbi:MAG: hypothetical protein GXY42_14060 [Desulfovibrionales bacterium]|nr:hypothetical protein [Desulfovibrionales bacterium]
MTLTDNQLRVLQFFADRPNQWLPAPDFAESMAVELLAAEGALEKDFHVRSLHGSSAPPTPVLYRFKAIKGTQLLQQAYQQRQQDAKEEAQRVADAAQRKQDAKQQRRHEWRLSLVSACVGAVLTLLIEHFHEVLVFLRALFHP